MVAVGPLGAGNDDLGSSPCADQCIFPFTVRRVPEGLREYGITVSHRGTLD